MPRDDFTFLSGPVVGSSGAPMPGVVAGGQVFLSGVIATGDGGRLVGPGDLSAQARQAVANLRAFLGGAGAGPEDVVKLTVYLCDAGAYGRHVAAPLNDLFGDHRPASTVVGVTRLVNPDALIEIDATAILR